MVRRKERINLKSPISAFKVAGVRFYPAYKTLNLQIGDQLKLQAEPTNPYDNQAIKVLKNDTQIGHVPKIQTHEYHPHLSNDSLEVIIIGLDLEAKYPIILAQGIYEPTSETQSPASV